MVVDPACQLAAVGQLALGFQPLAQHLQHAVEGRADGRRLGAGQRRQCDVETATLQLAQRLGAAIAKRGWRTVYGGGDVGLMGAVATSARNAGGKVLKIELRQLAAGEQS